MNHCGKACVCFVAPHGYPLELLDLTEEVFYQVAPLVNIGVNNERFRSPWMLGDNDFRAAFVEVFDNPIGVERFVSDQPAEIDAFDQGFNTDGIEAMTRQKLEAHQIAQGIDEGQNLRCHPAPGLAYGLALSPPFAP